MWYCGPGLWLTAIFDVTTMPFHAAGHAGRASIHFFSTEARAERIAARRKRRQENEEADRKAKEARLSAKAELKRQKELDRQEIEAAKKRREAEAAADKGRREGESELDRRAREAREEAKRQEEIRRAEAARYAAIGQGLPKAERRPKDYALVIGIDKYRSAPPADFAESDAGLVQRYLAALGVPEENIIPLVGPLASKADIAKYLEEWLPRNVTPESRVYLYYSGHGAPDPVSGDSYLVPYDGDAAFLATTAYPVKRLYEKLGALGAKETVVLLDACFSGSGARSVIAKGTRPLITVREEAAPAGALSVLSASKAEEIAGALQPAGHGLFTYFLLEGLKGAADADGDKHVSLAELHEYARAAVAREARRANRDQTPQLRTASPELMLY